jgi:CDP-4-dehydro-6-deoxyglucose reductase, E1
MVGSALLRTLAARGWDTSGTALSRIKPGLPTLDITNETAVERHIRELQPKVIFLPAAYPDVDGCELDEERAFAVNARGAGIVAGVATQVEAQIVYYSSDYVFDGKAGPYSEDDPVSPVSVYGRSKVAGEQAALQAPKSLVIRTTVLYGWDRGAKNFAMTLWNRLSSGERISVPMDQIGNPTLVDYLAEVSVRLVEERVTGVVNVVGQDRMPRTEFAHRLAKAYGLDPGLIDAVTTGELQQRAARPLNGGLKTERLSAILGTEPMALDESLKRLRRQWRADTHLKAGPADASNSAEQLKQEILEKVREYHQVAHSSPGFVPLESRVPYSGRVYGSEEMVNLVDASLDFWLTLGPWGDLFERRLKSFLGSADVALVNSGSSANLAAITALTSPQVENRLVPGDEVITPAVTFPTTLAPIIQSGLVPVFVDCEVGTYNIDASKVEGAISDRTRAIVVPHTLGNPVDLTVLADIARRHELFLVEDMCDALGATFDGRPVGTFGDLATVSFYPAHQMTMGEGGAVVINQPRLIRVVRSMRDWGRDCWCAPGESNTCGRRFGWCMGELPEGYDHKYTYTNIGYNLKPTDMQAAVGVAQLDRLEGFVKARRRNFARFYEGLSSCANWLILPRWDKRAEPSWFGFPVTVEEGVSRRRLVQWLEDGHIETRDIFGGSILRQPGYREIKHRISGDLTNSDRVARDSFFVGVYPGLTDPMVDFVIDRFHQFGKEVLG